jgi:hypothetical protein
MKVIVKNWCFAFIFSLILINFVIAGGDAHEEEAVEKLQSRVEEKLMVGQPLIM